jgi:hypothetical protein
VSRNLLVMLGVLLMTVMAFAGGGCTTLGTATPPTSGSREAAVRDQQCAQISDQLRYAKIGGSGLDSATMTEYGEAVAWATDGCADASKLGEVRSLLAKIAPLGTVVPQPGAPKVSSVHRSD